LETICREESVTGTEQIQSTAVFNFIKENINYRKVRISYMEKNYIWQGEYGKRSHLKASFKELLKEQDSSSLEMLAIFVNNNPYNFEFYIAVVYDIPKEEHVEKMIGLFENAGLVLKNDLTFFMFMNSMKDRRFNSCAFLGEQDIDLKFENMFDFVEIEDLKKKGYYMQPFGKEKQVFISHSSKDKKDVEMIIPYLNGQDLPVWFDKYSIPVGVSITEQVQRGIEESDMVIFWVTDNFLNSNWCQMEMKAYISRMIQENIRICIVMDDDIEIKKLPLFLRDIKHIRRDHRSVIEVAEEIAGIIKHM
jgi:hypothetical protein